MKKLYILITFLFLTSSYLSAQVDVVTGVSNPARILLDGNDLYIAESGSGTVSKIDVTATLPTSAAPVVNTGITSPYGLSIIGTDLYIADIEDGIIYKKNLLDTDPAGPLSTVVSSLSQPGDLVINGNYLYIAEYGVGIPAAVGTSIVSRIDLLNVDPGTTLETVITGVEGIGGIVFDGNNLYISSYDNDELIKIDISGGIFPIAAGPGDQVIAGVDQIDGLFLDGNTMYLTSSINVSTIDIMAPGTPAILATVASADVELSANGIDLYIAEINANKISKFVLSTASVSKYNTLGITMYPNPSSDFINISGLTNTASYEISNMLGAKVQTGKVSQNENINVHSLNKGMYFVKLENIASLKFIKK